MNNKCYLGLITFYFSVLFLLPCTSTNAQNQANWAGWGYNRHAQASNYLSFENKFIKAEVRNNEFIIGIQEDSTILAWGEHDHLSSVNFLTLLRSFTSVKDVVPAGYPVNQAFVLTNDSTLIHVRSYSNPVDTIPGKFIDIDGAGAVSSVAMALRADSTIQTLYNMSQSDVDQFTNITTISAGPEHHLAIRSDSTVVAWGYNFLGATDVPVGLSEVIAVEAGYAVSMALKADGTVEVWGDMDNSSTPSSVTDVIDIANGGNILYALKSDHTVIAWNRFGSVSLPDEWQSDVIDIDSDEGFSHVIKADHSLNYNNTNSSSLHQRYPFPMNLASVKDIACTFEQSLLLTHEGKVISWGGGINRTLATPTDLLPATAIYASGSPSTHTFMALQEDGTLRAWGHDQIEFIPNTLNQVIDAALGLQHGLALKSDKTVVAWGNNDNGQTTIPAGLSNVKAVAAGSIHSLALKEDGTVVAWGGNLSGQATVPTGLSNVKAIAAAYNRSFAIKEDGSVVAWGASIDRFNESITYQEFIDGLSNVVDIGGGDDFVAVLTADGNVFSYSTDLWADVSVPANLTGYSKLAVGVAHAFVWRGVFPFISSSFSDITDQNSIPITIQFDESITGTLTADDFVTENCIISNIQPTANHTFTATLTANPNITERTTLSVFLKENSISNSLGYQNVMSNTFNIDYWPNSNKLSGRIYEDVNANCVYDEGIDLPIPNYIVKAAPTNYFTRSKQDGTYELFVGAESQSLAIVLPELQGQLLAANCQSSYDLDLDMLGTDQNGFDFALSITRCPVLSVDVTSNRRRRCFESITTVTYKNEGFATAHDAKVYLRLPEYVDLISTDSNYTLDADSVYIFDVGTLEPGAFRRIRVRDSVRCINGITGLDQCTEAWITPVNSCLADLTPPPVEWDGSELTVEGECINYVQGSRFVIRNSTDIDMTQPSVYRLYKDQLLASSDSFQLAAGDSLVILYPPYGGSIRVEADQPVGHPSVNRPLATVNGCKSVIPFRISSANFFALPDAQPELEIDCLPIIDSYDPNDKLVTPQGITEHRFVKPDTRLEYRVRFQNTGTDTAYTVVVVDTLSNLLDISTLQVGATSHDYELNISGQGNPVLTWTFNDINLVDSITDEPNSHGFLKYSISPIADLPDGSIVHNFADIYFDFNLPIRTNDAWINYYDTVLVTDDYVFGVDLDQPIPTLQSIATHVNAPFRVNIQLNEESNFSATALTATNAVVSDLQGSGQNYSVLITPTAEGVVTLHIADAAFTDLAGNENGASNQLSTTYDITAPTSQLNNAPSHTNTAFRVDVQLTEQLALDLADFIVNNANLSDLQGQDGNYSILVTPIAEGNVTLQLPANIATDLAGNGNTASNEVMTVYDITAPTSQLVNAPSHANAPFRVDVQLTENIAVDLADFTVNNANLSDLQGQDGNYSILVTPIAEGDVSIQLPANAVNDLAGNGNTESNQTITIYDITAPTSQLSNAPSHSNAAYRIDVQLTENLSVGLADFAVSNANLSDLQGSDGNYSVLVTPIAEGDVSIQLPANAVNDLAGNGNTESNQITTVYDITAPTSQLINAPSHSNTAFRVDLQLTEDIAVDLADFIVSNANLSDLQGSNGNYSVLVTPVAEGNVSVQLPANVVTDLAGNGNTASNEIITVYDITAPTSQLANAPSHSNAAFRIDVQLTEDIAVDVADFAVSNANLSDLQGSNGDYSILVTPIAEGDVNIQLPANAISDLAGNGNIESNQITTVYDITAPSLTWSVFNGLSNELYLEFNEAVTGQLQLTDFQTTGASLLELKTEGNGYVLVFDKTAGNTNVMLKAGVVNDLAGNPNEVNRTDLVTSISNEQLAARTLIAPNPTQGKFYIEFSWGVNREKSIQVLDVLGKVVYEETTSANKVDMNISQLNTGAYLIRITSDDQVVTKSLIKR